MPARVTTLALLTYLLTSITTASAQLTPEIDPPKYGLANDQTLWSQSPADQQPRLKAQSEEAARTGWELLQRRDFATAMKRFNQAWTMHPENPIPIWGMATIQFELSRPKIDGSPTEDNLKSLDSAVTLASEAAALPNPPALLLNDNALYLIHRATMKKALSKEDNTKDLETAESLLKQAEKLEPHPSIYDNFALLESHRNNPEKAQQYTQKAQQLRQKQPTPTPK